MQVHWPPVASTVTLPRLRALRERKAWTQLELAEKAQVARGTVSNAEAGEPIKLPTVRRLAEALGVEPAQLMRESKD